MAASGDIPEEAVPLADKLASLLAQQEKELTCPVCNDIFRHPVLLTCSHSFCKACLQQWWTVKPTLECPVCKACSSQDKPPLNLALKNLCENFLEERRSTWHKEPCSLHGEDFKLFCLNHEQLACLVCRDSEKHDGHTFLPISEAAQCRKVYLQDALKYFQEKLEDFNKVKASYNKMAAHIGVQASNTERQLKKQFKKLRLFLQQEEKARITALREEAKRKRRIMMVKIEGLRREMAILSGIIKDVEADDITFLQNYKTTVERVQRTLPDPQPVLGALIDEAKHLGNLTFSVWDKMKSIVSYTPVILDPNTANPGLLLSTDLTSVMCDGDFSLPDNPERFDSWDIVLASEGFISGTHSWDVDVPAADSTLWELGVLEEPFQRKGIDGYIRDRYWRIRQDNGRYSALSSPGPSTNISLNDHRPQKIRVQLDWNRGELSFSDPETDTQLHTFTCTFTKRLFPYIINSDGGHGASLKVLPMKVCVMLEHHSYGGSG